MLNKDINIMLLIKIFNKYVLVFNILYFCKMKTQNEIAKSKESFRDSIDFSVECLVGLKQDFLNDFNHLILIMDDERRFTIEGSEDDEKLLEWEQDVASRYSRIKKDFDSLINELNLIKRDV